MAACGFHLFFFFLFYFKRIIGLMHLNVSFHLGNNMLLVGVHGPKTPCEEIVVKHLGNRLYNVTYLLKDKGDYILVVKWGDEHIPGSPYHVSVP